MKRSLLKLLYLLVLASPVIPVVGLVAVSGCNKTTTTPPTAPGYLNQADQQMGTVLAAAHAFYQQIYTNIQQGTYTPSPTEKTALNQFGNTLNVAQGAYLAYHNGTGSEVAAQTAVSQVQAQQAALQNQITSGVK